MFDIGQPERRLTMTKASNLESDMNATQLIDKALSENPDILVVLEIAARARETEAKEPPREIGVSTEVAAISIDSQYAV
jgi:hypothetical protein